jgi:hypothetical protein
MVYNINNEVERKVFASLSEDDKFIALYEIIANARKEQEENKQAIMGEITNIKLAQLKTKDELDDFKRENRRERVKREKREQKLTDLLDTAPDIRDMSSEEKETLTEKIKAMVTAKKSNEAYMPIVRDLIRIILAILAIIGGSKLLP